MNPAPKVSVLIPTYGYARYLPEALDSVLEQDFKDFELVVSDDHSSDGSPEILKDYARRDPRIRLHLQEKNLGMVANWNWCLQQARGEYVKFLFGDDRMVSPQALGRLVARLDANPEAVLAASARLVLDEASRVTDLWNDLGGSGRRPGRSVLSEALWVDRNIVGEPSCVLFRREAGARGFDPELRQVVDLEMWLHLLLQGDLEFDAEPLCGFRRHPVQQTAINQGRQLGPTESLIITVRYLEVLANVGGPPGAGQRRLAMQRLCQHRLYYSRKHSPRTADIAALEAVLAAQVPAGRAVLFQLWHRLTKPFRNLSRYLNGSWWRIRRRQATGCAFAQGPIPLADYLAGRLLR